MQQHLLKPSRGSTHRHKRKGIGDTYAGKGCKGQKARVGGGRKYTAGFEGGQISLIRRMPKLGGFRNVNRVEFQAVNLDDLENRLQVDKVSRETLKQAGLIKKLNLPIKILGKGKLTKKLTCFVDATSKSAKEAIEKAGGSIELSEKLKIKSQKEAKAEK